MRDYALIHVNGVPREVRGRDAFMMLADWLRREVGLPGTKIVCAEGDCGACTVLRAFAPRGAGGSPPRFEAVNSCIAMVAQMDGAHLVTVEGLQEGDVPAPAQEAMLRCHGSQCGYCTPGFVMAISGMLEQHPVGEIDDRVAANHLTGNLCRCTGYQPIVEAACAAAAVDRRSVGDRYGTAEAFARAEEAMDRGLEIAHEGRRVFAPTTLEEACAFASRHPECRVAGAFTDLGVPINKGRAMPPALLSLHLIPELLEMEDDGRRLRVGARVSLASLRRRCRDASPEFARFLNLFASPQIKNVATLVGNVATGSPIGDTLPFLLVAGGSVHVASPPAGRGPLRRREIPMTELYRGYRQLALEPGEIITHVAFDHDAGDETIRLYKVSQRKDLDITTVGAAFAVVWDGPRRIASARVAYGGVAAVPLRMPEIEAALVGELDPRKAESIARAIGDAVQPISDVRGTAAYRRVLAANLFRRFATEVLDG